MKIRVQNKRPVSVTVAGRAFRPRSTAEIEVEPRMARQIAARYGLVVEAVAAPPAVVPDVPRETSIALGFDGFAGSKTELQEIVGTGQPMVGAEMVLGADGIARGELSEPDLTCPECGRPCKSEFGLKAHQRSHKES